MPHEIDNLPAACVVKRGLSIGVLDPASRAALLALASLRLPADGASTEADVNAKLRRCLAEEAACLDTDHVELRRWLVDAGFWQRDGFGRAYRRVATTDAPAALSAVQRLLGDLAPADWVAARVVPHQQAREARRLAWERREPA